MPSKTNGRSPKCTRCRNHGVINDLRGHKHKCIWRDCTCTKCLISSDRQRATADRIALFRQQMKEAQCTYDIDRKQCGGKIEKRVFNKGKAKYFLVSLYLLPERFSFFFFR